jgi:hypothetical protein
MHGVVEESSPAGDKPECRNGLDNVIQGNRQVGRDAG